MTDATRDPTSGEDRTDRFGGAFRWLTVAAAVFVALIVMRALGDVGRSTGSAPTSAPPSAATPTSEPSGPAASVDPGAYLDPFPRPAPELRLTGPDGRPVSLASRVGQPVLVFFGYTHCPDVCPVTIGAVGEAIDDAGGDASAILVSVDPERDTIPWLAEFVKYMPAGFTAVTGTPAEVRSTADAWGVRYAKVDEGDPANYSMSHTADVFIVDAAGDYRGRFPFGTPAATMAAVLREVVATTANTPSPTASAPASLAVTPSPVASAGAGASASTAPDVIVAEVISSSVWAGGRSPLILALSGASGQPILDRTLRVEVQVLDDGGAPLGSPVAAPAVQPVGLTEVSFVPTVDLPTPGWWQVRVTATAADGTVRQGDVSVRALDPGATAPLGAPAPTARTPVAADFGGDLTWVTTDPLPDPRLSATSTTDALAARTPFVLVADSVQFRITPACGQAVTLARNLLDRWTEIPFIHLEPYRYTVITTEPVIEGSLAQPILTDPARAWGFGTAPWGVGTMPWVFVVDGDGIVRAKYQGVMGSADIDVILSLLASGG